MASPKEESTKLMNELLPLAERMLKEDKEFYPYGGYMGSAGEITHVGGRIKGTDHPKSQPIIDLLRESFRKEAEEKKYRATAIIFDVRIKPPDEIEKTDAIQVSLEHRDSYSVNVFIPYKIVEGELLFGKTFAQRGNKDIFV